MLRAAISSGRRRLLLPQFPHRFLSSSSSPSPSPSPSAAAIAALVSHPSHPAAQIQTLGLDHSRPGGVRFFPWASSHAPAAVNSEWFNGMLHLAAAHGDSADFLSLVSTMRSRGFGISKSTFKAASARFESRKMGRDAALLKEAYTSAHATNAAVAKVCKILRSEDAEDEKLTKLGQLGIEVNDELIALVLERIGQFPRQAMVFFRWVEGLVGVRVDQSKVYNAMAKVLGRKDCIDDFQDVLRKMRDGGFELKRTIYITVSERFHRRKMIGDAVDLYRFAMGGKIEKPLAEDFVFLLKKIVVSNDMDLKLVKSVVRIYEKAGDVVKGSVFDAVLKSLRSVKRLGECDRVLKAMEEGGFLPDSVVHGKAALALCHAGELDKAREYLASVEELGYRLDPQVWSTLVQKYFLCDNVDMSVSCFHEMLERRSGSDVRSALEALVSGLCKSKGAKEAYEVLKNSVLKKAVIPWHITYKYLIHRLIRQGHLKEAFDVLGLMKSNGFPPFIDPFISQITRSGTVDDAVGLLKAMTSKECPSRTVYMQLFEALFKEGRHEVAQQLLSKSPGSVRNHADVLDLFYMNRLEEPAAAAL